MSQVFAEYVQAVVVNAATWRYTSDADHVYVFGVISAT
jgi:hypothetical protein